MCVSVYTDRNNDQDIHTRDIISHIFALGFPDPN